MNDIEDTRAAGTDHHLPRRRFFAAAAIGATAVAAAGLGARAFAHGGPSRWHGRGLLGDDPAALDDRLDRMLRHLYVEIEATEAQKQQLDPLVKAAAQELLPLREQLRSGRRQAVALLSGASIDRATLEALRASQLALVDQGSRRLVEALADVALVLTPDQRRQIAARVSRWHGPRG